MVYIFASGQFWLNFNRRSKVYTKLKIVLIKVQLLSKVGIVLFRLKFQVLLFLSAAHEENSRKRNYSSIFLSNTLLNSFSSLFESVHPSLSLQTHIRTFRFRIENGERERKRKRERGAKKYRSGKLVLGGASQACAQFHGKILIEDNRS